MHVSHLSSLCFFAFLLLFFFFFGYLLHITVLSLNTGSVKEYLCDFIFDMNLLPI